MDLLPGLTRTDDAAAGGLTIAGCSLSREGLLAAAGAVAARFPGPVVRGASDGARDAIESADQLAAGWNSLSGPARFPADSPAKLPA